MNRHAKWITVVSLWGLCLVSVLFVHLHTVWQLANKLAFDAIVIASIPLLPYMLDHIVPQLQADLQLRRIGEGIAVQASTSGDDFRVDRLILRWKHRMADGHVRWVWTRLYSTPPWDGLLRRNDKADFRFVTQDGMVMGVENSYGDFRIVDTYTENTYAVYTGVEDHLGDWAATTILREACASQRTKPQIWLLAVASRRPVAVIGSRHLMPHLEWMKENCIPRPTTTGRT